MIIVVNIPTCKEHKFDLATKGVSQPVLQFSTRLGGDMKIGVKASCTRARMLVSFRFKTTLFPP